jgi:putative sterol carrier protein
VSLDNVRNNLQNKLRIAPPIGYKVVLDFGDDGKLFLHEDNQVDEAILDDADTTLSLTVETMEKIISGDTDPNMAVLMGKLKVSGKMGVALKLASYLEN